MPITINGKVYRNLEDQVKYLTDELDDLNDILAYIPVDATEQNKLATRSYVDQSVTTVSAHYLTSNIYGDNFPTKAALLTGPYYYGAVPHDPDENDYAFVNADEEHSNLPSRYVFINDAWQYQYSLQASGGVVDLTSNQTISGIKTFASPTQMYGSSYTYRTYNTGTDYKIEIYINGNGTNNGVCLTDSYFCPILTGKDLGANGYRWRDIYLSGKIYLAPSISLQADTGNGTIQFNTIVAPDYDNVRDIGWADRRFKDLYLSGNIIGSYKEANEVTISGNIATAHFNMDATTVNKIKYLEIYIGSDTIVSSFMIPVAAWNMSEWTSSTSIEAQPVPVSVMFNSNGLYVAVSDTGSTSVQVFAKMI